MSVYFHGSFSLNRSHLSGVLTAILDSTDKTDENIATPFGYRAPFTIKNRAWLQKTGLLKPRSNELTKEGMVIFEYDPKFESITTKWFMHHSLAKSPENAETWYFFNKEFLPNNDVFTREDLEGEIAKKFMPHSTEHFRKGSPMNRVISRKVLECYTKTEALGDLKLITQDGKNFKRDNLEVVKMLTVDDLTHSFKRETS